MPLALRRNLTQGELCVWCLDDGLIYLTGDRLAGCAFCEAGHRFHQRQGGPWNYKLAEITTQIFEEYVDQMTVEERKAWAKIQDAQRMAKDRGRQLELQRPVDLDQKPAKLEGDDTGQTPTPDTGNEDVDP